MRAPFAGTIYKTQAKKGEMVRLGDPLLWLADLEHLRVRANVDQVDLGRVRAGAARRGHRQRLSGPHLDGPHHRDRAATSW